ncbi:MAG: phenylalanine--tRNA ligase subunit alpha [Thermoplasmata archaeon]|nr:phenylalanine--tRNA ligase subunit alpha [Thermoplasmata archaeon]
MADGGDRSGPAPSETSPLSPSERTLLLLLREAHDGPVPEELVASRTGLASDAVRGGLQRLRAKHLADVAEEHGERLGLTPRGQATVTAGLPERRLLRLLVARGGTVDPSSLSAEGFDGEQQSAAVGQLRRQKYLLPGVPFRLDPRGPAAEAPLPEERTLAALASGTSTDVDRALVPGLRRRGLIEVEHVTRRRWSASDEGRRFPMSDGSQPLLGPLTPELLRTGAWRDASFRPYDVRAEVPYLTGARPHPYLAWLREFEEILIGLGFEQAEGPLLETEFWNSDVLFMPQEHPARSIHDVLTVEGIHGRDPPSELLERVAAVQEGRPLPGDAAPITPGWRTPYDRAIARRPVLRSQTTAVSARYLSGRPPPPFRMYCLDRNFRRESLDATHHLEFGQCEGVLGQEGIDLRHLVGIFRSLAEAIGIRELKLRPSYFPFTEPSIEGYVKHPRLGWIEVFPGGMLRPEVLRPLGIDVPVAAWGIGSTRLAMVALGLNDIRDLYLDDLDRLTTGRM